MVLKFVCYLILLGLQIYNNIQLSLWSHLVAILPIIPVILIPLEERYIAPKMDTKINKIQEMHKIAPEDKGGKDLEQGSESKTNLTNESTMGNSWSQCRGIVSYCTNSILVWLGLTVAAASVSSVASPTATGGQTSKTDDKQLARQDTDILVMTREEYDKSFIINGARKRI